MWDEQTFHPQPAITVRGVLEADADRLCAAEAARTAAAWAQAVARDGDAVVRIKGVTGPWADDINGTYDPQPPRSAGAPPDYRQRADPDRWLFLAVNGQWSVNNTESKDARKDEGWVCTVNPVEDGTLPHEVPEGGWKVSDGHEFHPQPALTVRAATAAESSAPAPVAPAPLLATENTSDPTAASAAAASVPRAPREDLTYQCDRCGRWATKVDQRHRGGGSRQELHRNEHWRGSSKKRGCGRCRLVWYCSQACRDQDWPAHKAACERMRAAGAKRGWRLRRMWRRWRQAVGGRS